MKTTVGVAVVVVAGLILLSACGGGGEGEGSEVSASPDGETETPGLTDGIGEEQPPDRSDISFVDNLLVKEEAGEWTRGEGLVATLKLFAGEVEEEEVLRHPDLLFPEGTGVFDMATEYLDDGPDADARAEISRLLDLLVFSNDQLEAMAGIGQPTAAQPGQLAPGASSGPEEDCLKFFFGEVLAGVGPCLAFDSITIDGILYRVFHPTPLPAAGWSEEDFERALETIEDTVPVYRELGLLPPINIVFSVAATGYATAYAASGEPCGVVLYTKIRDFEPDDFKQVVAHEMAHCFQTETFPKQNQVPYPIARWREEGLADYLSNVVYPKNNLEWRTIGKLEAGELTTTLMERAYSNSFWFQHVANNIGDDALMTLIEALPESGDRGDQEAALANARPGMAEMYQEYAEALTDQSIQDTGGSNIPFAAESYPVAITVPKTPLIEREIRPFGVLRTRIHMVSEDDEASLNYRPVGLVLEAARPVGGTLWASIPSEFPSSPEECGIIVVATSIEPATGFVLDVTEVQKAPELGCDRCLIGAWELNNDDQATLLNEIDDLITWTVGGSMTVVFQEGGQVAWSWSGWTQTAHEPGQQDAVVTSNGGGSQSYSTFERFLLSFSGPEIPVSSEVGVSLLDTGLGDIETSFGYECEGDRLVIVKRGVDLGWSRLR